MKNKLNFITKALLVKTLVVLMMIGMMDSQVFSQTRIRFAKGRSSTTVSGTVSANGSRTYILNARRGQGMIARADSGGSVAVEVDGVSDPNGVFVLNTTGDHTITVYNQSRNRSARFSLYVEIR